MNTLQEASTIYKTFKKGGPAFGGWQVRMISPAADADGTDIYIDAARDESLTSNCPFWGRLGMH
jgi:hypothetical protein